MQSLGGGLRILYKNFLLILFQVPDISPLIQGLSVLLSQIKGLSELGF